MTQIAYDLGALAAWAEVVRARGLFERAALIVGVAPLRSAKQARHLNDHLPGVTVPDAMIRELEDAGSEAEALGASRCAELITELRSIAGVRGVHVMGLGRAGTVVRVIELAGLPPRPATPTG